MEDLMKNIRVNLTPPPEELYTKLKNKFGDIVNWEKGTVFTYGTNIYTKYPLDQALYGHECTHVIQQMQYEGGPDKWWEDYINKDDFRLSEEREAYSYQYRIASQHIKDRNELFRYLHGLAKVLSSSMYGNLLSTDEAIRQIKGVV